jgi:beta-glucosidase
MVICLLLPTLVYMWAVREPTPRWRAAYFPNGRFEAAALVRDERDVNHDWRERGLADQIPGDRFSARWDSCLRLEHGQSVAFQLTSADPARLFIDGEPVIDDWGKHPRRTRGIDVTLQAGAHHLRVEYDGLRESASVTLAASFDDQRPRRIAPERLRFPDGDWHHPCKTF